MVKSLGELVGEGFRRVGGVTKYVGFLGLLTTVALASSVEISGTYQDKKGNAIEESVVEVLRDGSRQDSTQTSSNGFFSVQITETAVEPDNTLASDYLLGDNYPNPFNPLTTFKVETLSDGSVSVYDITGRLVDRINLPNPGEYDLTWGGGDRYGRSVSSGVYIYVLEADGRRESKKMTLLDGGSGEGLNIVGGQPKYSNGLFKATTQDVIRFNKDNTTPLELSFNSVGQDTSLGAVVGNVGPEILSQIPVQEINVGDTARVDLEGHVYNDDENIFATNDSLFQIEGGELIFTTQDDGTYEATITIKDSMDSNLEDSLEVLVEVSQPNRPPEQIETLPDMTVDEDQSLEIDLSSYVSDPDNDSLMYSVGEGQNFEAVVEGDLLTITPSQDYNGLIEGIMVEVSDGEYSLDLNSFDLFVEPVNDAPHIDLENVVADVDEDSDTPVTLANVNTSDVDGDAVSLELFCDNDSASVELQDSSVVLTSLSEDYNGSFSYRLIASDGELSDTLYQSLNINPLADLVFQLMNVYPDTLITQPGGEFVIDGQTYTAQAGTLAIQLAPGTYEFNATHPEALPVDYIFIKKDGELGIVEQRDYYDNSSPLTITGEDAVFRAYKMMNDFPWDNAFSHLDQHNRGTVRFASGADVTVWWNTNYMTPDSALRTWTDEVMSELESIPHVTQSFTYAEGPTTPETPYIELRMSEDQPNPGNTTHYDDDQAIISCTARYPDYIIGAQGIFKQEIYEGIGDMYDFHSDFMYFNSDHMLTDKGRAILALLHLARTETHLAPP